MIEKFKGCKNLNENLRRCENFPQFSKIYLNFTLFSGRRSDKISTFKKILQLVIHGQKSPAPLAIHKSFKNYHGMEFQTTLASKVVWAIIVNNCRA